LRDRYDEFGEVGAEIVAVSAEPLEVAQVEATAAHLRFPILCDPELSAIARFDVLHEDEPEGRPIARPSLFLVDRAGILRFAYVGEDARDRPAVGTILLALESLD
jgi:peroxiredoxin